MMDVIMGIALIGGVVLLVIIDHWNHPRGPWRPA